MVGLLYSSKFIASQTARVAFTTPHESLLLRPVDHTRMCFSSGLRRLSDDRGYPSTTVTTTAHMPCISCIRKPLFTNKHDDHFSDHNFGASKPYTHRLSESQTLIQLAKPIYTPFRRIEAPVQIQVRHFSANGSSLRVD